MWHQIQAIGNLGNDPEQKFTPTGIPLATFNLAINERWAGTDGQIQEKTHWVRVTAWRKLAENCAQYLGKGSKVLVIGRINQIRGYANRDGEIVGSLELTADTIKFLDRREANGEAPTVSDETTPQPSGSDVPF